MHPRYRLLFLLPVLGACSHFVEQDPFARYAAEQPYTQVPAPVDLGSDPDAPMFKTRLSEGAKSGPNFAGRYTIVSWGCGSSCQTGAVISADSGAITDWFYSCAGYSARLDSRLLVINPQEHGSEFPGDCYPEFYQLHEGQLEEIPLDTIDTLPQ